jgi:hypothetical protein
VGVGAGERRGIGLAGTLAWCHQPHHITLHQHRRTSHTSTSPAHQRTPMAAVTRRIAEGTDRRKAKSAFPIDPAYGSWQIMDLCVQDGAVEQAIQCHGATSFGTGHTAVCWAHCCPELPNAASDAHIAAYWCPKQDEHVQW